MDESYELLFNVLIYLNFYDLKILNILFCRIYFFSKIRTGCDGFLANDDSLSV